jgi:hypothetical protein
MPKPDDDEDEPSPVTGMWMPQWGSESRGSLISKKYFLYPMEERAAFGTHSVDDVREEMDCRAEQAYAEELAEAKSTRSLFTLIGIIPFAVGWGLSFWWLVDLPMLLSTVIWGNP